MRRPGGWPGGWAASRSSAPSSVERRDHRGQHPAERGRRRRHGQAWSHATAERRGDAPRPERGKSEDRVAARSGVRAATRSTDYIGRAGSRRYRSGGVSFRSVQQYLDLLDHVLTTGAGKGDRTGTGTLSVFGHQMRFDLAEGFPALTTKRLHMRSVIGELLWFLRGVDQRRVAARAGRDDLGRVGRRQGRAGPGLRLPVALLADAGRPARRPDRRRSSSSIRTNPDSRRHLVSAWNVADLDRDGAAAVPHDVPVLRAPTGGCPASSTSARPTSSSACRSTSRRTPC